MKANVFKKMKQIISFVLIAIMICISIPFCVTAGEIEVSSTELEELPADAIPISSAEELGMIGYEYPMDGYYYLTQDIDMTESMSAAGEFYNDGLYWEPIGTESFPFTGTFDGRNHTITGLILHQKRWDNLGLFGYVKNAYICNINLSSVSTIYNYSHSSNSMGFIVGYALSSTIKNCKLANITMDDYCMYDYFGGIVGIANKTNVSHCYTDDSNILSRYVSGGIVGLLKTQDSTDSDIGLYTVQFCTNSFSITGRKSGGYDDSMVGGIVGWVECDTSERDYFISNCTNTGNIIKIGSGFAGGILGYANENSCSIMLCSNTGDIVSSNDSAAWTGSGLIGGIATNCWKVSKSYSSANLSGVLEKIAIGNCIIITDCYTNKTSFELTDRNYAEISNCYSVAGGFIYTSDGVKKTCTDRQLRAKLTYDGWDFENTWTMEGNEDYLYPELIGNLSKFKKSLTSISVAANPDKLTYIEGKDSLDLTGAKLLLAYDNGTTEVIDITEDMVSGFDNTMIGKNTIKVKHLGKETTFSVTILAKSLSSISVTTVPTKTEYLEAKDTLDVSGGEITLYYNNDTTDTKAITASMVSGFDNTVVGTQSLTVSYGGKSATYDIEIIPKTLTGITVSKNPTKGEYLEAKDSLDVTGAKLKLSYDNGQSKEIDLSDAIDDGAVITGFNNKKVGEQTLTVHYLDFTASFNVKVVAKSVSRIVISKIPDTLNYLEAKYTLDVSGGQIRVTYNNGTEDIIDMTEDMVSGFDNTVIGMQALTVTYKGKSTVYEVEIFEKLLIGIEIKDLPAKLTYREASDKFNATGGRVVLYYNNETSEVIDMTSGMVSGFDNSIIGPQILTVTYKGFTDTFDIEIIAKSLISIAVTNKPNKLNYLEKKDDLDITGGKITLYYDNDTIEIVDITESMVSGFDNTIVGEQTLTVNYLGKSATYNVKVIAKSLLSIAVEAMPQKVTYKEGDSLDLSGAKIVATYNNDELISVPVTIDMVTGFNNRKAGTQHLTINYGGKTTTFEVEVSHNHVAVVTDPTCTTGGYTTHTCTCGDVYVDTYTNALNHDYQDNVVNPTCVNQGYTEHICSRCEDKITDSFVPAISHAFGEWIVTTAPTCTLDGEETKSCANCDATETQIVSAIGHSFGEWALSIAPTCVTEGTELRACANCDITESQSIPATGEHIYGEWEVTTDPTVFEKGVQTRKCENCDATESEEIDKLEMTNPFTDVKDGQWYTEGILWCYHSGYMAGVSDTEFGRKSNVTRAMFATILAKIDGSDISGYSEMSFADVKPGQWYSNAIEWAASNGYAAGLGGGLFGYKQNVSREQIALFFYTYSSLNEIDVSAEADLSAYTDLDRVHSWALDAVEWAVAEGLISGMSETTLAPRESATRAEIALIVKNYVESVKN